MRAPILFLSLLCATSCGGSSSLEVTWHFSDLPDLPTAADCSKRGVDSVRIEASNGAKSTVVTVPCHSGRTTISLADGLYGIEVLGVGPRGELYDPRPDPANRPERISHIAYDELTTATVTSTGSAAVTFNTLPNCANGIDDDRNGLTDNSDPACLVPDGDTEGSAPPPATLGELALSWTIDAGRATCADAGIATIRVADTELREMAKEFPCGDGAAILELPPGARQLEITGIDATGRQQTARLQLAIDITAGERATSVKDFPPATYTGTLQLTFSWGTDMGECPPLVEKMAVQLTPLPPMATLTPINIPVDGLPHSGCAGPLAPQRVGPLLDGRYSITVQGLSLTDTVCFTLTKEIPVAFGENFILMTIPAVSPACM